MHTVPLLWPVCTTALRGLWPRQQHAPSLVRLRDALAQETLDGGSRGILFQAIENLGSVAFGAVSNMVKDLSDEQRRALGQLGLRFGTENIYLSDMLKPRAIAMRARLWAAHAGNGYPPPPEGRVSVDRDPTIPVEFDRAIGYARVGGKAVRIDMLERVAAAVEHAVGRGARVGGRRRILQQRALVVHGDADGGALSAGHGLDGDEIPHHQADYEDCADSDTRPAERNNDVEQNLHCARACVTRRLQHCLVNPHHRIEYGNDHEEGIEVHEG